MSEAEQMPIETTTQEAVQETAPVEEKVTFTDDQQKVFNNSMSEKAFEVREARRKSEDLQRQLDEAKAAIPQETQPAVPDMPDPYDENFNEQVTRRDEAIRAKERFDSNQRFTQDQSRLAGEQAQRVKNEELGRKAKTYEENAIKKGLNFDEVKAAGNVIINYGLREDVINEMLTDADGSLMSLYMSKNPQAIDSLNNASPVTLGNVYADIKAKSSALGVRQPTAPDPAETLRGAGVVTSDGGPDGATYE